MVLGPTKGIPTFKNSRWRVNLLSKWCESNVMCGTESWKNLNAVGSYFSLLSRWIDCTKDIPWNFDLLLGSFKCKFPEHAETDSDSSKDKLWSLPNVSTEIFGSIVLLTSDFVSMILESHVCWASGDNFWSHPKAIFVRSQIGNLPEFLWRPDWKSSKRKFQQAYFGNIQNQNVGSSES